MKENLNIQEKISYSDIEGVWTHIHFSYSDRKREAIGFIRYGHRGGIFKVILNCAHIPMDTYAKFILGG